jgi:hypothetical protein
VAGRVRSIEKSNDLVEIRTHDLLACNIVPQLTTLPHAPYNNRIIVGNGFGQCKVVIKKTIGAVQSMRVGSLVELQLS